MLWQVSKKLACREEASLCSWLMYLHRGSAHTWWDCCRNCSGRINDKVPFPGISRVQCCELYQILAHVFDLSSNHTKCMPYPGPLSVLVMDNAAQIHHGNKILELPDHFGRNFGKLPNSKTLTDCLGVRIEYLPPYSQDLNPLKNPFQKSNISFDAIKLTTLWQLGMESYMICMRLWTSLPQMMWQLLCTCWVFLRSVFKKYNMKRTKIHLFLK